MQGKKLFLRLPMLWSKAKWRNGKPSSNANWKPPKSLLATSNAQIASTAQANEAIAVQERQAAQVNEAIAIQERQRAQEQALISSVRELSNAAHLNLEVDPERSILPALQALNKTYTKDHTVLPEVPEAEDALHRAVQASRIELTL